jgi:uncharacterized protein YegP (UPF0339 family)
VTKLLSSVLAAALVVGLAGVGGPAPAQDKKDKDTKTTKAAKGGATIEVNEGKDGKYRFLVRDADGKLLAMSGPTGFETKAAAEKAVDALKAALPTAKLAAGKKDGK